MKQDDGTAGQADIPVAHNDKFTVEVKHELADTSPAALLEAHRIQAATYSVPVPSARIHTVHTDRKTLEANTRSVNIQARNHARRSKW